jgi:transposase InsO family protein
VAYNSSY